jgi:hypothetical protein
VAVWSAGIGGPFVLSRVSPVSHDLLRAAGHQEEIALGWSSTKMCQNLNVSAQRRHILKIANFPNFDVNWAGSSKIHH